MGVEEDRGRALEIGVERMDHGRPLLGRCAPRCPAMPSRLRAFPFRAKRCLALAVYYRPRALSARVARPASLSAP